VPGAEFSPGCLHRKLPVRLSLFCLWRMRSGLLWRPLRASGIAAMLGVAPY